MSFTNYADVKNGYANLWARAVIRPERVPLVHSIAEKLLANKARYERVSASVPWWFVAIIHQLESGGDFSTHLHNGDPLAVKDPKTGEMIPRRTVHVPIGRPMHDPPFTWEGSAFDALQMKGLTEELDWSPPKACWNWEIYNGLGYTRKGVNSPYVWSFTNLYEKGKYVKDGVYDPEAVSKQVGAATILKQLIEMGEIEAEIIPVPAHKTEVAAMQKLNDVLESFARIAPVIVTAAAGPMAGLAVKALAEAFESEPNAEAVAARIESAPLTETVNRMAKAEATMKALEPVDPPATAPDVPTPRSEPVNVDPTMQPGPIDKVVGGYRFTGWKTILGGALFALVSILEIFNVAPGLLSPDIIESGKWIAGLLAGVGVISKVERWITLFKPQTPTTTVVLSK